MITRPKLLIRKGVLGTRLRPSSENKDSTIGPGGQVDTIAVFDLYFNSPFTFSLLISYLAWYFYSTLKIANNFKGSVAYMVEDETGKYWETKACAIEISGRLFMLLVSILWNTTILCFTNKLFLKISLEFLLN